MTSALGRFGDKISTGLEKISDGVGRAVDTVAGAASLDYEVMKKAVSELGETSRYVGFW